MLHAVHCLLFNYFNELIILCRMKSLAIGAAFNLTLAAIIGNVCGYLHAQPFRHSTLDAYEAPLSASSLQLLCAQPQA
jgi:hypothetical protein